MPNKNEINSQLIEEILEMDGNAKLKIDNAKDFENKKLKQINFKNEEMLKSMEEECETKLNSLKSFKSDEFENKIKELEKIRDVQITRLQNCYEKNETSWVECLVNRVLKI